MLFCFGPQLGHIAAGRLIASYFITDSVVSLHNDSGLLSLLLALEIGVDACAAQNDKK